MARIKYGAIIAQASGSVGGITFQKCSYGNIMRSKPLPIHSRTISQLDRRAIMRQIQYAWTALSDADQLKWKQFVSYSQQTIIHDRGVLIGGYSLFLKYQFCRRLYNLDLLTSFSYVPIPAWPNNFIVNSISNQLYVQFDRDIAINDYFFIMFLSNPRIPSQSYSPVNCRFMYCNRSGSDIFVFTQSYINNFGILAQLGDTLHFSIYYFSLIAPLLSGFSTGKLIVGQQFPNVVVPIPPPIPPTENIVVVPNLSGFCGIAHNASGFVAITSQIGGNNYATSPDGINWTPRAFNHLMIMRAIVWSGNYFLLVGDLEIDHNVYSSSNGINWTPIAVNGSYNFAAVGTQVTHTVAISNTDSPTVLGNSTTANSFAITTAPVFKHYTGIAYGVGKWVIVSNSPGVVGCYYSTDRVTWSPCITNWLKAWSCICFGNGVFVAGNSETNGHNFAVSPDGINWTISNNSAFGAIYAIAYYGGRFVAVGQGSSGNAILESSDGLNWLATSISISTAFKGVIWGTDKFVAVNEAAGTLIYFD